MNDNNREYLTAEEEEKVKKKFEQKDRVTENQVHTIIKQAKSYFLNLEKKAPDAIKNIWEELILLYEMLKDWSRGEYQAPWKTISAVAFALAYVMNPLDVLPDFIPFLGYLDDATIVKMTLDFIHDDVQKYKESRKDI
jgi:uncharacterized membrane protein YkvA (DUF1232 family)